MLSAGLKTLTAEGWVSVARGLSDNPAGRYSRPFFPSEREGEREIEMERGRERDRQRWREGDGERDGR